MSDALKTLLENLPEDDRLRMTETLVEASSAIQERFGRAASVDQILALSATRAFALGDSSLTMADLVAEAGIKIQSLTATETAAPEEAPKTDLSQFNPALRISLARGQNRAGSNNIPAKAEVEIDARVIEKLTPQQRITLIRGGDVRNAVTLAKKAIAAEDAAME